MRVGLAPGPPLNFKVDLFLADAGRLALIETPEALEGYLLRAQGQDDAKRRAQRCITAVQEASRLAAARGWLT